MESSNVGMATTLGITTTTDLASAVGAAAVSVAKFFALPLAGRVELATASPISAPVSLSPAEISVQASQSNTSAHVLGCKMGDADRRRRRAAAAAVGARRLRHRVAPAS